MKIPSGYIEWSPQMQYTIRQYMKLDFPLVRAIELAIFEVARPRDWPTPKGTSRDGRIRS